MLQSIRDHTHGWIAGIIVSLLILSFALWGIHSYMEGGAGNNTIAKVNGVEITKGQLSASYERLRRQLQMQYNSNHQPLPPQAEVNLKERALQTLINVQILKEYSLEQNYRISPHQIDNFLENMPEFQVNGQFSTTRFQQLLDATLYSAGDFLDLLKTSLLIDQPRLGLIFTSFALPNEISETMALVNQEREIQYAVISLDAISKQPIQISEASIKNYYNEHQNEFKTLEQVSISYIDLSLNNLMLGIHPTDEMLKTFYTENSSSFTQPFLEAKNKVKELYIHQKAESLFGDIRDKLANISYEHPESLDAAAKALNLPIKSTELFTKDKGGKDLTANSKVRDAAFSHDILNLQNNSDVIQISADEAIVLRVKTHSPATVLPLKTVENQIINKLKSAEFELKISNIANEIKAKLQSGADPAQIAQQYQLAWKSVDFVGRRSNKISSAILNTAFAMPKPQGDKKLSYAVAKIPEGYAVINLVSVRNALPSNNHDQYQVFAEQVQNTQGLMEYELYKQSAIHQAKVVLEN